MNSPIEIAGSETIHCAVSSRTLASSRVRLLLRRLEQALGGWCGWRPAPPFRPVQPLSEQLVRRRSNRVRVTLTLAALLVCGASPEAGSTDLDPKSEIEPFVARMAENHGVPARRTRTLLADARVLDSVLEAVRRPAERKPWYEYRKIFITERRIARGAEFWRQHAHTLTRAAERFGVPPEIIVAIIGVESFYGNHRGRIRVLDALATLGFRYPRRSAFFLSELEAFVLLSGEERLDARGVKGSYAGAMGIAQFISSSYRNYAIDFDGDGSRDLMHSPEDAIGSIANYLSMHGWLPGAAIAVRAEVEGDAFRTLVQQGMKPHASLASIRSNGVRFATYAADEEQGALLEFEITKGHEYWVGLTNFYVITRYNHSRLYALAVFQLAQRIRERYGSG